MSEAATTWTVLCVDDEPNILAALRRVLRQPDWRVLTAGSGREALALMDQAPVDLVISDMRMPEMDGAELLAQVQARWPGVLRILLTGQADLRDTIAAINRGGIFRYLHKPWEESDLLATVRQAMALLALGRERDALQALTQTQNLQLRDANTLLEERVQARTAELSSAHEQLKRSYLTSIKVFSGLMEMRAGRLAGHGRRVADTVRRIGEVMGLDAEASQQLFVAALLHDIGLIGTPDTMLERPVARYTGPEMAAYQRHAELGEQALMPMEDMREVATLIGHHHARFDGRGMAKGPAGHDIPLGARILAVADTLDDLQHGHLVDARMNQDEAVAFIRNARGSQFDPEVVDTWLQVLTQEQEKARGAQPLSVGTGQLTAGMVLARDLVSSRGILMLTAGHRLSVSLIQKIKEFEVLEGGTLTVHVRSMEAA